MIVVLVAIIGALSTAAGAYFGLVARKEQSRAEVAQAVAAAEREAAIASAAAERETAHSDAEIERAKLERSGSVATSQAAELWAESSAIRMELRAGIAERDKRLDAVEAALKAVEDRCDACHHRETLLTDQLKRTVEQLADARARLAKAGL